VVGLPSDTAWRAAASCALRVEVTFCYFQSVLSTCREKLERAGKKRSFFEKFINPQKPFSYRLELE
jgi:hypothetical protein